MFGAQGAVLASHMPNGVCKLSDGQIHVLLVELSAARAANNHALAVAKRDELNLQGVRVSNDSHIWNAADGRKGVSGIEGAIAPSHSAGFSAKEIELMLRAIAQKRDAGDGEGVERLTDELRKHGVSVNEGREEWRTIDGRSGSTRGGSSVQVQAVAAAAAAAAASAAVAAAVAAAAAAAVAVAGAGAPTKAGCPAALPSCPTLTSGS